MEYFELLNNERLENGYISNQIKTYKRHCNRMKRLNLKTNKGLSMIYSMESNIAKFKLTGSLEYLKKNIRILKKDDSDFSKLYQRYVMAFIQARKGSLDIDQPIQLRNSFGDYYGFLTDIYYLNDNRHDFNSYKVKYQWKDVIILFETKTCLESFLNKTFNLKDNRFNTQLARKILYFEEKYNNLNDYFKSSNISEFEAFIASKKLGDSILDLKRFLSDNFVESVFVSQTETSCMALVDFLQKLVEFKNGIIHKDIDSFVVPEMFLEIEAKIDELKTNKSIKISKLKNLLLKIVEDELNIDSKEKIMPILPTFYDLAFDYVTYDKTDILMSQLLNNFTIEE